MSHIRLRSGFAVAVVLLVSACTCVRADEPRLLEPTKVEVQNRYTIRSFTARPGDVVKSERGGDLEVIAIRDKEVEMKRTTRSTWVVGDYNFGNHEQLCILSIDPASQTVMLRFRTKNRLSIWDAFSF